MTDDANSFRAEVRSDAFLVLTIPRDRVVELCGALFDAVGCCSLIAKGVDLTAELLDAQREHAARAARLLEELTKTTLHALGEPAPDRGLRGVD